MKKTLIVLALTLVFVMGFSAVALATNPIDTTTSPAIYKSPSGNSVTTQGAYPTGQTNPYIAIDSTGVAKNIHSGYQRNTDACASCHATHTATGAMLLQWSSVSATCDACHDGTVTTTYNVNNGKIAATSAMTYAGLFDYAGNDTPADPLNTKSLSRHNVSRGSFVNPILGAPGGSIAGTADKNGSWAGDFECVSCHEPHGSLANYRILNPNANNIAVQNKVTKELLKTTDNLTYSAVKGGWLNSYPNKPAVYTSADGGTTFTKVTTGFSLDLLNGKVIFTATPGASVYVDYTPGLLVRGTVTNKLLANETVAYTSGMNDFCGACHTDYNAKNTSTTKTYSTANGVYSTAYRHPVGYTYYAKAGITTEGASNFVTCLTCHVAHGANTDWWNSWKTRSGWLGTVTTEDAGTSALKRLPNMSTCEACHAKGSAALAY